MSRRDPFSRWFPGTPEGQQSARAIEAIYRLHFRRLRRAIRGRGGSVTYRDGRLEANKIMPGRFGLALWEEFLVAGAVRYEGDRLVLMNRRRQKSAGERAA